MRLRRSSIFSLLFCMAGAFLLPGTRAFDISCANARIPDETSIDFCSLVTWRAAVLYTHINGTDLSSSSSTSGSNLFSDADQDHIARRQYHDLVSTTHEVSVMCERSLQRFVCASVFPECPAEGFAVPYVPVCKSVCREAESECGLPLSCEHFQSKDCTAAMEEGFFVLKDDQGPYEPLPYLYAGLLMVWTAISCMWLYQTFVRYRHGGSRLCRLLSCVPIAKVSMMMLSLAFWSTCVKWGYCSFWMGVSLINCQLMYETFSLIGFVLIAKGWCVTRPSFHSNEWRNLVILMCSFYLASSSLLLIRRVILSSIVFWLCTGLLYGSAYAYVIFNVQERLRLIRRQMRRAVQEEGGGDEATAAATNRPRLDLMMLKHWMYQTLSTLLTIFCMTELFFCLLPIVHHIDLTMLPNCLKVILSTAAELDARLWLTLVIHEVVEILVLFLVGFVFRPRLISAFYYIELEAMGGAATDAEGRQLLRPPPLYLIPVSSHDYGDGADVSVPRGMLSPTDVTYTRAAYSRYGYHHHGADAGGGAGDSHHHHHHHHHAGGGGAGAAMVVQQRGATLTRRQHRDVAHDGSSVGLLASSVAAVGLGGPHGAGALISEQLSPLLLTSPDPPSSSSLAISGGGMGLGIGGGGVSSKAHASSHYHANGGKYHAHQFLVVAQPFGSFAIAVPDPRYMAHRQHQHQVLGGGKGHM